MASSAPLPLDFNDPKPWQNKRENIFGICIPFLIICWMATIARLGTRFYVIRSPGWDDVAIVWTMITVTASTISFLVSTNFGMGDHIYLLTPENVRSVLICHWLFGATYPTSTALIKISLLLQYLRIFERGTKIYRFTCFMLVVMAIWGVFWCFTGSFICLPNPAAFWNGTGKGCYMGGSPNMATVERTVETHSGFNVLQDFIVLSIPLRLLFLDDAPTSKRNLAILLLMGLLTCGFSVWRFASVVMIGKSDDSEDVTWAEPAVFFLSLAEIFVASMCASVPFFWPIVVQQFTKIMVMYEFNVSSEPRWHDDQLELETPKYWPEATDTATSKDSGSMNSRHEQSKSRTAYYGYDHVQHQGNPFSEEFMVEEGGLSAKQKNGFARFDDSP